MLLLPGKCYCLDGFLIDYEMIDCQWLIAWLSGYFRIFNIDQLEIVTIADDTQLRIFPASEIRNSGFFTRNAKY